MLLLFIIIFFCLVLLPVDNNFFYFVQARRVWNVAIKRIFLVKFKEVMRLRKR